MIKRQQRDSERRGQSITERDLQIRVLNNFLQCFVSQELRSNMTIRINFGSTSTVMASQPSSPYFLFPQLYNFQNNIYSLEWPVMNRIFEAYLTSQSGTDMRSAMMRNFSGSSDEGTANMALQENRLWNCLPTLNMRI
jgi:hypothetical protein